jgi:hypothetical protein
LKESTMTLRLPLRSLLAFAFAAGIALPPVALSAPCAGFIDVDDTDAFCPNVEWLKNRRVTLGCTSTTAYCPGDPVTRLSMAAFLHRLGNAMTALQLTSTGSNVGTIDLDATFVVLACANASFLIEAPRFAHGEAQLIAGGIGGPADIAVQMVESTDNGATWNAASPIHVASRTDNASASISVMLTPRDLTVGTDVRYTLRASRAAGSLTMGDLQQLQCQVNITLENRNPTSSPFDADD